METHQNRGRQIKGLLTVLIVGFAIFLSSDHVAAAQPSTQIVWNTLADGVAYTWLPYLTPPKNAFLGNLFIARINPTVALFRVYYQQGKRQSVHDWAVEYPGAALIVNASFFDGGYLPEGLVRLGNDILSLPLSRLDSGLFTTSTTVPQVLPTIDASALEPSSAYRESFESFPVLIKDQHLATFKDNPSERARRSVIAQDDEGNILIIYSSSVELSLTEMATWIQDSGLSVVTALNLDGGSSAQLHVSGADFSALAQGDAQVPVVLAVYLR